MTKERFIQEVRDAEVTLYRVSKSILHHEQYCLDAVQEALCQAFAHRAQLKDETYFKTWLVRILIHECYKIQKERKKILYYDTQVYQENHETNTYYTELYHCINQLKPKMKMVIVLYYIEGFSIKEISRILKIPEGTVKSRLAKARKELKLSLSEEGMALQ